MEKLYNPLRLAYRLIAIFFLLSFEFYGGYVQAAISDVKIYQAVGDRNYPPLLFLNENGVVEGFDYEVLTLLEDAEHIEFNIHLTDWNIAQKDLLSGKADVLIGLNQTSERKKFYDFTESYLENKSVIFVRTDSKNINGAQDLSNVKVGIQAGDLIEEFIANQQPNIKHLQKYNNQIAALNDLKEGKIDAVLGNYIVGVYWMHKYGLKDDIKVTGPPVLVTPYCLAVKKGNKELLSQLNSAIRKVKENGDIARLQNKYLQEKYYFNVWFEKNEFIKVMKYLALFGGSILFISLALLYFLRLRITRATSELKEVNHYYKALIENASDVIVVIKKDTTVSYFSPSVSKILGYAPEEMKGMTLGDFIHPTDLPQITSLLSKKNKNVNQLITIRVNTKYDSVHIFEVVVSDLLDDDYIEGIILNGRDITERLNSEKEIRMLAQTVKNISECVCITDMKNKILFVNEAFQKTYGYSSEEIINEHISIIEPDTIPKQFFKDIYFATLRGGWQGEVMHQTKAGITFPVSFSTAMVCDNREIPIALVSVSTDITDRKIAEKELVHAKEKAEKSDRLKSEFLAQMSHEIRTPVNAILSFTSLLRDELESKVSDDLRSSFTIIDNGGRRLIRTIDMILNMSEIQAGNFEISLKEIDIYKDVLDSLIIEFMNPAQAKKLNMKVDKYASQHKFIGDVYTVTQIFQNLLDNAVKYTNKGSIDIKIYNSRKHELCVDIKDTGIGISDEYLPMLFEPFSQEEMGYTRRFEGNGLGLSLVKKYIELNNADIKVQSKKGEGTTFTVIFNI